MAKMFSFVVKTILGKREAKSHFECVNSLKVRIAINKYPQHWLFAKNSQVTNKGHKELHAKGKDREQKKLLLGAQALYCGGPR